MRLTWQRLAVASAAALVGIGGCGGSTEVRQTAEVVVAPPAERLPVIDVVRVRRRRLQQRVTVPVRVVASPSAEVTPAITATIGRVLVRSGETVKRGQLLVELSAPRLAKRVRLCERAVKHARADHRVAEAEFVQAQRNLGAGRLAAGQGRLALMHARQQSTAGVPGQVHYLRHYHAARVSRDKTRRLAEAADRAKAHVVAAAARIDLAVAKLSVARGEEQQRELRSPIDGVVVSCDARPGALAEIGKAVITLADEQSRRIILQGPAGQLEGITAGKPATLRFGGGERSATVARVRWPAGAGGAVVTAELKLDAGADFPAIDSVGEATLLLASEWLPAAPKTAVGRDGAEWFALVISGGAPRRVAITPGLADADWVGITSGLAAGDRVAKHAACGCVDQPCRCRLVTARHPGGF